jgi:hypothetical protein
LDELIYHDDWPEGRHLRLRRAIRRSQREAVAAVERLPIHDRLFYPLMTNLEQSCETCPVCGRPLVKNYTNKTRRSFVGCSGWKWGCLYIKPGKGEPPREYFVETDGACSTGADGAAIPGHADEAVNVADESSEWMLEESASLRMRFASAAKLLSRYYQAKRDLFEGEQALIDTIVGGIRKDAASIENLIHVARSTLMDTIDGFDYNQVSRFHDHATSRIRCAIDLAVRASLKQCGGSSLNGRLTSLHCEDDALARVASAQNAWPTQPDQAVQVSYDSGRLVTDVCPCDKATHDGKKESLPLLNKQVGELGFCRRTRQDLDYLEIHSIGDLLTLTVDECKERGLGRISVNEIREKLSQYGFTMRDA